MDEDRAMKHFLLLSTGQNVANVLPVLELYQPGDTILWLESSRAHRYHWAAGAIEVLRTHHIPQRAIDRTTFDEHPAALAEALEASLQSLAASTQILWAGNGGTKPQSLAMARVLDRHGAYGYLYSLARPCGYEFFPKGLEGPRELHRYHRARLTMEEVVRIAGYELQGSAPGRQLWPGSPPPTQPSWYGNDIEATVRFTAKKYHRTQTVENRTGQLRSFHQLWTTDRDHAQRWIDQLQTLCRQRRRPLSRQPDCKRIRKATNALITAIDPNAGIRRDAFPCNHWRSQTKTQVERIRKALNDNTPPPWPDIANLLATTLELILIDRKTFPRPAKLRTTQAFEQWQTQLIDAICNDGATALPQRYESFYNHTLNLAQRNSPTTTDEDGQPNSGELFEKAVQQRLLRWLEKPERKNIREIIAGVWANVCIVRPQQPLITMQELDIAIVLRNGILLALECKAGRFDQKDLDARILNLQNSATTEASMRVVLPVFIHDDLTPETIDAMIKPWQRLGTMRRLGRIAFTLPGQPHGYHHSTSGQTIDVPDFEQALDEWLAPYHGTQT